MTIAVYTRNPDLIELLRAIKPQGMELFFALNKERLEELLHHHKIRILIYDRLQLNKHDVEYLKMIRKNYSEMKIFLLFLYFEGEKSRENELEEIVDEIFTQPCNVRNMFDRLSVTLSISR